MRQPPSSPIFSKNEKCKYWEESDSPSVVDAAGNVRPWSLAICCCAMIAINSDDAAPETILIILLCLEFLVFVGAEESSSTTTI